MPISTALIDTATRRAPKFISPKAHAAIDYLMTGIFFVSSALFWRRNRRAGFGALLCGGAVRLPAPPLQAAAERAAHER